MINGDTKQMMSMIMNTILELEKEIALLKQSDVVSAGPTAIVNVKPKVKQKKKLDSRNF